MIDYMINYISKHDGSLVIVLNRCNNFNDHKALGSDGAICMVLGAERRVDIDDAKYLIDRMQERLAIAEETS